MDKFFRVIVNVIFCIQILLLFLLFMGERIELPPVLQVAGRMHPLILHIPIGVIIFLVVLLLVQKKFDTGSMHQVIYVGLLLTSLSASAAALFGYFLSIHGDYGGDILTQHKVAGVALSWLCYLLLIWYRVSRKKPVLVGLGVVICVTLVFTGHSGSVLTHGENFLFEPMSAPDIVLTAENASLYQFAITPILQKKCYSCHNDSKAKGGLVMTTPEKFKKGGENGKPWTEGKPEESRMIKSFYLPLDHDEHMPPDGKPQLTALEIGTLKAWIKAGADFDKKIAQFPEGDSLKILVASLITSTAVPETGKVYKFDAADESTIKKINTPFRTVAPLYQNSPALAVDFYVRKEFQVKSLEELKSIENQIVVLNLSKMPVTDKELNFIASFRNIESLNLNFSAITGTGLRALGKLSNLQALSLAGTAVDAKSLEPVLHLPQLKELFLWSTKVTDVQADSLRKLYPAVAFILSQFNDESKLQLSKPMLVNEGVIKKGEEVVLKHPMPGVTIYYTLDGSDPDTLKGNKYERPFVFDQTTTIRARGCKDGWLCSDAVEVLCFVEGIKPAHMELLTSPDPQYPGEGVVSLSDGRKGISDVLKEPSWLGYRSKPFEVGFEFEGNIPVVNEIILSYARNVGGYSLPPKEIELWAGKSKDAMKLVKKIFPEQPKENGPVKVDKLSIPLDGVNFQFYKLIARPVASLPSWHSGKGEKAWIFFDEMFIY